MFHESNRRIIYSTRRSLGTSHAFVNNLISGNFSQFYIMQKNKNEKKKS